MLVHCRGGLGRAGTVAAALLIELGETPREALRKVRAARPGAVETRGQERYIAAYKRMFDPKASPSIRSGWVVLVRAFMWTRALPPWCCLAAAGVRRGLAAGSCPAQHRACEERLDP